MSEFQIQVINGILLGDGCINTNLCLQFNQSVVHAYYFAYVLSIFCNLKPCCYFYVVKPNDLVKTTTYAYRFIVNGFPEFKELRQKWYPDGKKIVPKDLILNKIVLSFWYQDDGCFFKRYDGDQIYHNGFRLYTNNFQENDVSFLIEILKRDMNINSKMINKKKTQSNKLEHMIYIGKTSFSPFLMSTAYICYGMMYKKFLSVKIVDMKRFNDMISIKQIIMKTHKHIKIGDSYYCMFCDHSCNIQNALSWHVRDKHMQSKLCEKCSVIYTETGMKKHLKKKKLVGYVM